MRFGMAENRAWQAFQQRVCNKRIDSGIGGTWCAAEEEVVVS